MIITLEASDIVNILQRAVSEQYRTPNCSISDKSLKKLQKIRVELSVVHTPSRTQNSDDLIGNEAMQQLAQRMRVEEEPENIITDFRDSGM